MRSWRVFGLVVGVGFAVQMVNGATVGAGVLAVRFNRQKNARMSIPRLLLRTSAVQGQLVWGNADNGILGRHGVFLYCGVEKMLEALFYRDCLFFAAWGAVLFQFVQTLLRLRQLLL